MDALSFPILFFQRPCWELHPVEQEHDAADRPRLQHFLHGLLLHQGEGKTIPTPLNYPQLLLFYFFFEIPIVHRRERQVLVHAWAVLLRGLLHHPPVLRVHLPGPDLDRAQVPEGAQAHDSPWHPSVPEHTQDVHLHQVCKKSRGKISRLRKTVLFYVFLNRLAQLISIFISVWLTAAGIIHLVSHHWVISPFFVTNNWFFPEEIQTGGE